jgi:hypothetical protein
LGKGFFREEQVMRTGAFALILLGLSSVAPAIAQIDLAGEWNPRFHEDQPERIPGPEIGGCFFADHAGAPMQTSPV